MELGERLCTDMETVSEFTFVGDRVCTVGGCEAAMSARTRCGWVKFGKCVQSYLYERDFL